MNAPQPDNPGAPRALDPRVEQELIAALKAHYSPETSASTHEAVRAAVVAAAEDARARQLRPEELVLAFKSLELRAGYTVPDRAVPNDGSRSRMLQVLLAAYYKAAE